MTQGNIKRSMLIEGAKMAKNKGTPFGFGLNLWVEMFYHLKSMKICFRNQLRVSVWGDPDPSQHPCQEKLPGVLNGKKCFQTWSQDWPLNAWPWRQVPIAVSSHWRPTSGCFLWLAAVSTQEGTVLHEVFLLDLCLFRKKVPSGMIFRQWFWFLQRSES